MSTLGRVGSILFLCSAAKTSTAIVSYYTIKNIKLSLYFEIENNMTSKKLSQKLQMKYCYTYNNINLLVISVGVIHEIKSLVLGQKINHIFLRHYLL